MRRRQSVSGFVPEFAGKLCSPSLRAIARGPDPRPWSHAGVLQFGLNPRPQLVFNYGVMLPNPDVGLVPDLANIDRIAEQCVDLAARV